MYHPGSQAGISAPGDGRQANPTAGGSPEPSPEIGEPTGVPYGCLQMVLPKDLAIKTIELLLQSKYDETENRPGHAQVLQLLKLCLRTYFTFDGTIYEEVKGTPMGSPISGFIVEEVLQRRWTSSETTVELSCNSEPEKRAKTEKRFEGCWTAILPLLLSSAPPDPGPSLN
ncbi:hypothetical protein SprV_0100228300 [Sparganum proliferum]